MMKWIWAKLNLIDYPLPVDIKMKYAILFLGLSMITDQDEI